MDQDTRRQITWIAFVVLVISVVVLVAHRQTEVDNLLQTIAERPPDARVRAVTSLIADQKLAEALEDQPRWTQDRTVEAAGSVGTESAIEALVAIKPIVDAPVAARIDSYLVSLGTRAVGPLVLSLQDKDGAVRGAASAPLKSIGEPAVVSLMPLIDVYDDAVRGLVSTTLGGIGEPAVKPLLLVMKQEQPGPDQGPAAFRRAKNAAVAAFNAMGETALDPVINELLKYDEPDVRLAATGILGTVAKPLDAEIAARAVPPLLDRLQNDDEWAVRRRAASALAGLGEVAVDNGAVQPLIARLSDTRAEVRASAAQALGTLDAEAAAQPLANLLLTNRIGATAEIADALEKIGEPSIAPLTPALNPQQELEVRLTATQTIATIGTSGAVVPLGRALTDNAVEVRRAAADALRNLADERVLTQLANALADQDASVYYAARDALARMGSPAVPVLLDRLSSENTRVAYTAEQALARIGAGAVQPLTRRLRTHTDESTRWAAIALGQIGEQAVDASADLLGDSSAPVSARVGAARALGLTGAGSAIAPLSEAAENAPPAVREAAVRSLGEIGDERATEALVARLEDPSDSVREATMEVLVDWRLGNVDDELTEVVGSEDQDAARRAAIVLADHTPAASGELIRTIGPSEEEAPGQSDEVRARLESTVQDASTSSDLRSMAINALRWVGSEASLDALAPLVSAGSQYADVASKTIGHIGQRLAHSQQEELKPGEEPEPSRATNLLLNVYETAGNDDLRLTAAAGLAVMGGQPVQSLIEMLREDTNPEARAWVIAILGSIGKPAVEPLLDARGRSDDPAFRDWIASSLMIIGDARAMDLIQQLPDEEQPDPEKIEAGREIWSRIQQRL